MRDLSQGLAKIIAYYILYIWIGVPIYSRATFYAPKRSRKYAQKLL